jgi:hypothetical protein
MKMRQKNIPGLVFYIDMTLPTAWFAHHNRECAWRALQQQNVKMQGLSQFMSGIRAVS